MLEDEAWTAANEWAARFIDGNLDVKIRPEQRQDMIERKVEECLRDARRDVFRASLAAARPAVASAVVSNRRRSL